MLVAIVARAVSRSMPEQTVQAATGEAPANANATSAPPRNLVLVAAGVSGFVFCLMEIVWYRMLGPLLGGSVFTFGLILAVALAGIGTGGLLYAALTRRRPDLSAFAWTCVLEALFVAVPYAYGDKLAVLTAIVRPVAGLGFATQVFGWALVTIFVVFPAALLSGVQFPLLIALLERDRTALGRDVGLAYACNTAGAIVGSLSGGFGLLPALTAPGCWRLVGWLLLALGAASLGVQLSRRSRWQSAVGPAALAAVTALALRAAGPTAAWRHSPIGAGRVDPAALRSPNDIRAWLHNQRRAIAWSADGRESSVGITRLGGYAFAVNGKVDGHARLDAPTTVMLGLLGAYFQEAPERAMVIGLGTGESAGWLAAVPSMKDVDVVELEPAIVEMARRSDPANHGALENPKVHLLFADAREALLTSRQIYDVIASEPSNPYRAGVSSLFTREFYEAGASRLSERGVFVQWVQAYEIDGQTLRTVFATLASVFPYVETWEGEPRDLLLVASKKPIEHGPARLRARLQEEPYRSAFELTWRAADLEGVLGHFIAGPSIARLVAEQESQIATDDLNPIEFGFARWVGSDSNEVGDVRAIARSRNAHRPDGLTTVDWAAVDEYAMALAASGGNAARSGVPVEPARLHRMASLDAAVAGNMRLAATEWQAQGAAPLGSLETSCVATALADVGDEGAERAIEVLRPSHPVEADLALGRLLLRKGDTEGAWNALERAYVAYRTDPWPQPFLVFESLRLIDPLVSQNPKLAPRIWTALKEPFVLRMYDETRMTEAASLASRLPPGEPCVTAFLAFEPNPIWSEDFLVSRATCYAATRFSLAPRAEHDVLTFRKLGAPAFGAGL